MAKEYILVEAGTRRKLLAALLPSVPSRTQEKSWWTCAKVPRPHNEMDMRDSCLNIYSFGGVVAQIVTPS
jgi:hypothetical protein